MDAEKQEMAEEIDKRATRIQRQMSQFVLEPANLAAFAELLKNCPLAVIKGSSETGNVLVVMDCNAWGEADARPQLRTVPMGAAAFKYYMKGCLSARYGTDEPEKLHLHDICLCFSTGKDRKRLFTAPLKGKMTGKSKERTLTRVITTHASHESFKARRKHAHGTAKLSSSCYLTFSAATLKYLPPADYPHHGGFNRSDMFGPITLPKISDILI